VNKREVVKYFNCKSRKDGINHISIEKITGKQRQSRTEPFSTLRHDIFYGGVQSFWLFSEILFRNYPVDKRLKFKNLIHFPI